MNTPRNTRVWGKRGERGFSILLLTMTLTVMLGVVGLAIDLGRMFIYETEIQTFTDASALAAVAYLDGTQSGVQKADQTATAGPLGTTKPNGYNFDTVAIGGVTTGYATSFGGPYDSYSTANANGANNYRFISVSVSVAAPLNFLPLIPGISSHMTLKGGATAGQQGQSTVSSGGLLPFAPDAHNQGDAQNFGFIPGTQYTLKWDNGNKTTCAGDAGFTPAGSPPSEHGFVDIGEGDSNSNVAKAIEFGGYPNAASTPSSVTSGMTLGGVPGNRGTSIFDALLIRVQQDTDRVSSTWNQYKSVGTGNGRRVVTVAVGGTWSGSGSNAATPVLGFGNFLLNTSYAGSSGAICATYIGPGDLNGYGSGGTDGSKVYVNVLYK